MVEVKNLTKKYSQGGKHEVNALNGVSFNIPKGQFVAIMGPSGSGKSTLLHLLGGLDSITSGEALIDSNSLSNMTDSELSQFRRQKLGFIFQFFNLLPTMTALENVCLPLLLDKKSLSQVEARAKELLNYLNLSHRMNHYPDQLSGGEMQRVAIARALIAEPVLILADEPTGNLDSKTGHSVLELLRKLSQEKNQTIVMVTHSNEAASYATRLIEMRDGKILTETLTNTNAELI
ncbi:MAG: ABC transporter ATP-binding protein [Oligoflexia bacterium]|nr:ABC transporter ATP-binding protein [Oligoflexia bacterium]